MPPSNHISCYIPGWLATMMLDCTIVCIMNDMLSFNKCSLFRISIISCPRSSFPFNHDQHDMPLYRKPSSSRVSAICRPLRISFLVWCQQNKYVAPWCEMKSGWLLLQCSLLLLAHSIWQPRLLSPVGIVRRYC